MNISKIALLALGPLGLIILLYLLVRYSRRPSPEEQARIILEQGAALEEELSGVQEPQESGGPKKGH
jgi:hypothetical protein